MKAVSAVLRACLAGGIIGIICQICMMVLGSFGLEMLFVLFWTIMITGAIGALMAIPGRP